MQGTTNQPILGGRRSQLFPSWQRTVDYYNEGVLLWLDVDSKLRELTRNKASLDDFARAFFGVKDKSFDVVTYTFDHIVKTLNAVSSYDWKTFCANDWMGTAPSPSRRLDAKQLETGFSRRVFRVPETDR